MRSVLFGLCASLMLVSAGLAAQPMTAEHPNALLIAKFYRAFAVKDAQTMATCYRADVHFSDEVFPDLHGAQAGGMWRMLCTQGKDLKIVGTQIEANDTHGRAHWEAWYTFSATGKKVHNVIEARFELKDGLVARHVDTFDFWTWSKQAFGVAGTVLGWTPFLKSQVRRTAARSLAKFLADNP